MRTVGRKIRGGEKSRAACDRCGTVWDRRLLHMDGEGMLVCPQEGHGRDGATLTRLNVAHAKAWADRSIPGRLDAGSYPQETPTPIASLTAGILAEDGTPITGEDGVYLLQD